MDYQEAFDLVTGFYQKSWDNLICVIGWAFAIILGIAGIIYPVLQWRIGTLNTRKINDLRQKISSEVAEHHKTVDKKIAAIETETKEIHGLVEFIRTNAFDEYKMYPDSLVISLSALVYFLNTDNGNLINKAVRKIYFLFDTGKITRRVWENMPELRDAFDKAIKKLEENGEKYREYITELKAYEEFIKSMPAP
jgi:hypothetical protein